MLSGAKHLATNNTGHRPARRARSVATLCMTVGLVLCIGVALAAEKRAKAPLATGERPLLKQLNQEMQSLYHQVQSGVCRVQLPPPRWAGAQVAEQEDLLKKWGGQLDGTVKQKIEEEQRNAARGQVKGLIASVSKATTQPASQPGQAAQQRAVGAWTMSTGGDDVLIFRPGNGGGTLQFDAGGGIDRQGQIVAGAGQIQVNVVDGTSFTPNNIGLLLDGEGHMLVPICVEKESFGDEGVRVMVGAGQMATAKFVGNDRQMNITLLKLDKPVGTPVKLAEGRPVEGSLTMFLSPNSGVGRLMVWTNELKDWGVVVSVDGGVFGFARHGQFLSAAGCKPALAQLIKAGKVMRPVIGVAVKWVQPDDSARENGPLGSRPAVRVMEVAANSAGEKAGIVPGDLILEVNDQAVGDPSSFAAALSAAEASASAKVLRGGMEMTVSIQMPKAR